MKAFLITLVVIVILAAIGFGGWYFFLKKSPEGGSCRSQSTCEQGLNCVNNICSSGKVGSGCITYKDCESGLLCTKSICAQKPDYSKYFSNVIISKIKPGSGPGPDNPETVTNTFTRADSIEMDFVGVKSTTVGEFYYEIVNSTTGELLRSSQNELQLAFSGQDRGTGTSLDNVSPGQYDLNIYYNNEMIYSSIFTVTE